MSAKQPYTDLPLWLMLNPEKWRWQVYNIDTQVIKAGKTKKIYDERGSGFLYYFFLTATGPSLKWTLNYLGGEAKGKQEVAITTSFNNENTTSGVANAISGYRVLKRDTTNNIHTVEFGPGVQGFPGIPFTGWNIFSLENPAASDVTYSFLATLLRIFIV